MVRTYGIRLRLLAAMTVLLLLASLAAAAGPMNAVAGKKKTAATTAGAVTPKSKAKLGKVKAAAVAEEVPAAAAEDAASSEGAVADAAGDPAAEDAPAEPVDAAAAEDGTAAAEEGAPAAEGGAAVAEGDAATEGAAGVAAAAEGDAAPEEGAAEGEGAAADTEAEAVEGADEGPVLKPPTTRDDISPKGNCSKDVARHCKGVTPGSSNLANCISFHVKNEKSANEAETIPVSDGCKVEVRAFKAEMYRDLSMDKQMSTACRTDISKFCDDDFLYPEPGNIVACLREVNQVEKLTDACKAQVLRAQMDAADDFLLDPQLRELCSGEAERLCKGVEPGEGRVQTCLREHRSVLAWDCQAELFRQEVENSDDIRLNVRLFQACLNDQRKFCAEVKYGDARVKDCLEEHRLDPEFSPQCKTEFDKMMERRAVDFRLDPSLRKYCKNDITEICYPDADDITDVANWDAKVIQCLQDYRDELTDPKCKQQVHRLTKRAAEDIRFDKPLADACYSDRQTLCKGVPDGMAQVFLCLQEHTSELKDMCRSALFEELVRFAEDIDFKFPMKMACSKELNKFCKDVPEGHAAKVKCLEEKIDDTDMGEDCRKEINRDLQRTAEDYRLNYRLNKACFTDVSKLCAHACDDELESGSVTCHGRVVKCLQEQRAKIESAACKQELFSFSRLEARDPLLLDVPLKRACSNDTAKFCKGGTRDHARTLSCLRAHRDELTAECKAEEMRFSIMEASDIRLTPSLMNACGQELQGMCADVPPADGAAFKCLQGHIQDVAMGAACKGEVNLQELRHASNYRLDVRVSRECEADVARTCKDADQGEEGHALVLKCMVNHFDTLSGNCQTEVSYAVRMALWQYKTNASFTAVCDKAVSALCEDASSTAIEGVVVGVYGQCLTSAQPKQLGKRCAKLVRLVRSEGDHAGGVDTAKLDETLAKIAELQAALQAEGVKVHLSGEDAAAGAGGLVVTGWMALVAVAALAVVLAGVAFAVYQHCFSRTRGYTLVVKGGEITGV